MEQTLLVKGLEINYKETGEGYPLVLLHGWGSNLQAFTRVQQQFENNFRVISIDLPGFGESDEPKEVWGVEGYVDFLEEFFKLKGITNPILGGHSHGGRVSILYASRNPVHKLLLIDAAGIKPKRKLKYYFKVYSFKLAKKILPLLLGKTKGQEMINNYRKTAGSTDYNAASAMMRQIMVKCVNADLKSVMPKIQAPTLLVWGENDTATPLSDGQTMEKLIPNAGLVVLKGVGHFSFIEKLGEFLIILDNFLTPDKKK